MYIGITNQTKGNKMSLAVDHVMEMLEHAELDPEHWEELSRRVKAKAEDLNPEPFKYGLRVVWTDPDGGNQIHGEIASDHFPDNDTYWVQFDGAADQTEVFTTELRIE